MPLEAHREVPMEMDARDKKAQGLAGFNKVITTKRIKQTLIRSAWMFFISLAIFSCLPENKTTTTRDRAQGSDGNGQVEPVNSGYGRLLDDNPIILSGQYNLSPNTNLNRYLGGQELLVLDQYLNLDCQINEEAPLVSQCIRVKQDQNTPQLNRPNAKWAFDTKRNEFLEVNTFGHMKRIQKLYFDVLNQKYQKTWEQLDPHYESSIPMETISSTHIWNSQRSLWGYANCDLVNNASFSPATFSICMGRDSDYETVRWAQDSTIIYHEMGHALNHITFNLRNNVNPDIPYQTNLGSLFYDEGNSIEEGIADFASYLMNGRTHLGEWAMGRFNNASRPMSEDDGIHIPGIDTTAAGRLSYPTYVTYDPNFPDDPLEDVHFAGQIISHYLVALTQDLEKYCEVENEKARKKTLALIIESLSELGDLGAKGRDFNLEGHINHSADHSFEWIRINNPVNFRSFAQSMARSVKSIIVDNPLNQCQYTLDDHEKLLDSYGLLLFRTYNESGNHKDYGHLHSNTHVATLNRAQTVLISKDLLKLSPEQNASEAFVFDNRSDMISATQSMKSAGQITEISSLIESDLPYNNGNGRISPGEVFGITPNLYNDSNSMMGGVQVLANDWDHFKWTDTHQDRPYTKGRPCNHLDGFPSQSLGGADTSGETGENPGECKYTTRQNGHEFGEQLAPICLVQINDDDATKWAGQNELRERLQLEKNRCLGGEDSPNDCFMRAIKGADQAFFSHIAPKKTWAQTVSNEGESPKFNISNLIFMEVSPWVPPGTIFKCRYRARFTNCNDCFHDPKTDGLDFLDFEYSGGRPFKIINLQFTVID